MIKLSRIVAISTITCAMILTNACGKKASGVSDDPQFNETSRVDELKALEKDLNVRFDIDMEAQVSNEGAVNYLMRVINKNRQKIKEVLDNVQVVHIGNEFGQSVDDAGVVTLSIPLSASEADILNYIPRATTLVSYTKTFSEANALTGFLGIDDFVGLSRDEQKKFADKVKEAAQGLDLKKERFALSIRDGFTLSVSTIGVPSSASADEMGLAFKRAIALKEKATKALADASSFLGYNISIQNEVLTPDEFEKAVSNIDEIKKGCKAVTRKIESIIIGRRFYEPETSTNGRVLIDFRSSAESITSFLNLSRLARGAEMAQAIEDAARFYSTQGAPVTILNQGVADDADSVAALKASVAALKQNLPANRMLSYQIHSIEFFQNVGDKDLVTSNGNRIRVSVTNNRWDSILLRLESNSASGDRAQLRAQMDAKIQSISTSFESAIAIQFEDRLADAAINKDNYDRLSIAEKFFAADDTKKSVRAAKIRNIEFGITSVVPADLSVGSKTIHINLGTISVEELNKLKKQLDDSTAAPAPGATGSRP